MLELCWKLQITFDVLVIETTTSNCSEDWCNIFMPGFLPGLYREPQPQQSQKAPHPQSLNPINRKRNPKNPIQYPDPKYPTQFPNPKTQPLNLP